MIVSMSLWVAATNTWIVSADDRECVVIDAPPEPQRIIKLVRERNLRIAAIIATHGHIDHVGGIWELQRYRGDDDVVGVWRSRFDAHYFDDPIGNALALASAIEETPVRVAPPELVNDLDDGAVVRGAGLALRAIATPGHTPGSTCLLTTIGDDSPVLFSGDHLFAGSIGRTDLPGGSLEQLLASMRDRILPLPDDVVVLPGHGPATTIGHERATNPFLRGLA